MYSYIVNALKSIVEKGVHGTVMDFAVLAGLALIALCLAMILWKVLRHTLVRLKKNRQLREWRKGKGSGPKAPPQGQPAR
jgi:predicted Co/Zn/Cd cation transporter (cation efflux family)